MPWVLFMSKGQVEQEIDKQIHAVLSSYSRIRLPLQNMLEGKHIPLGLGTHWEPPERAGGFGRGDTVRATLHSLLPLQRQHFIHVCKIGVVPSQDAENNKAYRGYSLLQLASVAFVYIYLDSV